MSVSLKEDLKLDKFDLDSEAEKQASIYLHWSNKAAEARRARDRAKLDYEVRRSELAVAFRASADKKPTNDQVCEYLDSHHELVRLRKEWIERDFDYADLEGACTALEQKKSMIENLIKLHLNQYFSRPGGQTREGAVSDSFRSGLGSGRRGNGEA